MGRSSMNISIISLLILLILGFLQRPGDAKEALPDARFNLRIGQKAHIKGEGLTVGFSSVNEDSRCPQGVDCIWAGNAVIAVSLSKPNGDPVSIDLNANMDPKEKSYQQYVISLVALNPYPKKDSIIKKEDYVATFVVRKTSN